MAVRMNQLLTAKEQEALLSQAQKILSSEYFRNSQRCSRFLDYSVRFLLRNEPQEELKERRIGMEVFHRPADYDTAHDNIVRVTANEVRKRLAQYYASTQHLDPLILELPAGTYSVSVRPGNLAAASAATDKKPTRRRATPFSRTAGVILMATCGVAALLYIVGRQQSELAKFWAPLVHGGEPVLISVAEPIAYEPATGSILAPKPGAPMVPLRDALVGTGDAFAMADIARYLSSGQNAWRMVAGNDLPSQDLRAGPIVLIGVHSNQWTSRIMSGLRYTFGPGNTVLDRGKVVPAWSLPALPPDWQTEQDYAIVSRFRSSQTGQFVLILAGLTNFGTQAAGEFATSNELLEEALRGAPHGWQKGNVQFVLYTRLIGRTPDRPRVVATYFW